MKQIEGYRVKTMDRIKGMRSRLPKGSPIIMILPAILITVLFFFNFSAVLRPLYKEARFLNLWTMRVG